MTSFPGGLILYGAVIVAIGSLPAMAQTSHPSPLPGHPSAGGIHESAQASPIMPAQAKALPRPLQAPAPPSNTDERWGIRIEAVRLSGHGHIVDLRYRVLDPTKAARVINRRTQPQLVEQETGARLSVPNLRMIGSFRQTPRKLIPGRTYFIAFANNGAVRKGSRVTVILGDLKVDNLLVG